MRRYRRLRGLSQARLAELVNTDKGHVGRLEAGSIAEPSLDLLRRIAAALDVRVRDLADPGYYDDAEQPSWEAGLLADDRLDDSAKDALLRILRPLLAESDEGQQQAG